MKLYEIEQEIDKILSESEDGELTQEQKIVLDSLLDAHTEKLESIGKWILNNRAEADKFDVESKRLQARRDVYRNRVKRSELFLKEYMERNGMDKVAGELLTVSLRNTPGAVHVSDFNAIPDEYKEPQPDKILKSEIGHALKNGVSVPGAELVKGKSLSIK